MAIVFLLRIVRYSFRDIICIIVSMCLSSAGALAQSTDEMMRRVEIDEVEVISSRKLSEIGGGKSNLDTLLFKSNISSSMAEVLLMTTGVYVKHSGRASLSTVAIRGAGASHTQVTWNGLKINSPMMGQVDFSTMPAYFMREGRVLYAATSLAETSGGLGGTVVISTPLVWREGLNMEYVQNIGSWSTFDEYFKISYGKGSWQMQTQALLSTSKNDYSYINRDYKENIYDDNKNIIGQYYPKQRNTNGEYRDLHLMKHLSYKMSVPMTVDICCWYTHQDRQRPLLSSSYVRGLKFENRHREQTWRTVLKTHYTTNKMLLKYSLGYQNMWTAYDYRRDPGNGDMVTLVESRNREWTLMNKLDISYTENANLSFRFTVQHDIVGVDNRDRDVVMSDGTRATIGYDKRRYETSFVTQMMWRPCMRMGVRLILREELCDMEWQPLMPALMADYLLCDKSLQQLTMRATVSKNYRRPSLNDLYYVPGGNHNLKAEDGYSCDMGIDYIVKTATEGDIKLSLSCYNTDIDNWVMWLPTAKGFFSPRNIKRVHAYGVEIKTNYNQDICNNLRLIVETNYTFAKSINKAEKMSNGDQSVGKQLPYIPLHSGSARGIVMWRNWQLDYWWSGYSQRYTMSSNAHSYTGTLKAYGVENLSLRFAMKIPYKEIGFKMTINNLLDKQYQSILSRPMPGRSYTLTLSLKNL